MDRGGHERVMGVQTVVAIWLVRFPRLRWAYYALMPAMGGASLVTWHGLPSIFAAAATVLSTIGRMQSNGVVLRILLLASTPCWMAHDLAVASLPGLVADLLSMATGATMLLRRIGFTGSLPIAFAFGPGGLGLFPLWATF
jgi:Bacterial inner membrane protein